jgi:3-oxoacyl-ACP reductase-like protein
MSIFTTILGKLGIHKKEEKPAAPASTPKPLGTHVGPTTTAPAAPVTPATFHYTPGAVPPPAAASSTPAAAPKPAPMEMVDVVSHLDALAKKSTIPDLNWKQSIVDLLKLLGLPANAQAIKDLAVELGCPEKEMSDSYKRNVWTHKELLRKIAENGGNIPQNLLD